MAPNPEVACGILTNIGELWLEEEFCDLTINIDDYQFRCHKFHLSANSAFFKTLLRSEKTDGSTNSISHVTIRGIDPEIFGLVLKVVYKGENCVAEDNMIQVWHAAHELQIDVLVSKCEDFVMAHMTLDNYESIYHSSVLLESARVRTFAVEFMAEHFDKFRETSLFLDLPSKFLMDVLSSEALVVGAREDLVDSILMWASHRLEPNDESDDSPVVVKAADDLNYQAKGDKQCVEIMFGQPPTALEDESNRRKLRQILQETGRREETLGKLLNLAKLEQTSPDYIKSLEDNDWLMGIKEARKTVLTVIKTLLTSKPPITDEVREHQSIAPMLENVCKDAVVYKLVDSETVLVHRATTGKRHMLITDSEVLNSQLVDTFYYPIPTLAYIQSDTPNESYVKVMSNENEFSHEKVKSFQDTRHLVVGKYLYQFYENTRLHRTPLCSKEDESTPWYFVGNIPSYGELRWTMVHEKTIIVAYKEKRVEYYPHEHRKDFIAFYSFDTTTLGFKKLGQYDSTGLNEGIFYMHDEMYIIQGSGQLWRVSLTSAPGKGVSRLHTLWSFTIQIYSAIQMEEDLIIFGHLPTDISLPTRSNNLNLNLKFVQVWPQDKRCLHVWLPQSWLGEEV